MTKLLPIFLSNHTIYNINNKLINGLCSFDVTNTKRLWMTIREDCEEKHVLNFDPKIIGWEDYIRNIHILGLIKYAIK